MFKLKPSYKIIEPIGEGLNASVYKVLKRQPDLNTDHIFALKVLKRSSDIKVFKLEFETLLQAHGKHLVRYCGWERYKSRPALLLEYIDGVTVYELFKSYKINEAEASWIYQETEKGLKELSDCELVHGDLSLKNIMIQKDGNIKLIDFGLSHWSTQRIELTPEFADPRILNGSTPSYLSDITSLNKIIDKICPDLSVDKIKANSMMTTPESLIKKVSALKAPYTGTSKIAMSQKSSGTKNPIKLAAWALTSFLFFNPASAHNSSGLERMFQIRSKNWIEISNKTGNSCHTPCSLNLKTQSLETLLWKTEGKSGSVKVYTGSKKTISIDI